MRPSPTPPTSILLVAVRGAVARAAPRRCERCSVVLVRRAARTCGPCTLADSAISRSVPTVDLWAPHGRTPRLTRPRRRVFGVPHDEQRR